MPAFDVPLINTPRQSLVTRLSGVDCKLTVWWQPSSREWFATVEVPAGTPLVAGRRLTAEVDLLTGIVSVLPGRLRLVPLQDAATEPGFAPWGDTHALHYEVPD